MGAQLRVYKRRIRSVTATKKITKAMEMIAASRVVKAQRKVAASTPYATELTRAVSAVATGSNTKHPLTTESENPTRAAVLLLTSDRGLAGAFNSNIIREGMRMAAEVREQGAEPSFAVVGRKGVSAMTFRKQDVSSSYVGFTDRPAFANAREIGEEMTARYVDEDLDRVELIYNRFVSPLTQHVWRQTLLPLQQAEVIGEGAEADEAGEEETEAEKAQSRSEWFYEPDAEELLGRLIPEYVTISVYRALLESAASELGARMTAMRNAAENAEEMIGNLTLEMNRARQAEITQEILEVVAGAEALG